MSEREDYTPDLGSIRSWYAGAGLTEIQGLANEALTTISNDKPRRKQ